MEMESNNANSTHSSSSRSGGENPRLTTPGGDDNEPGDDHSGTDKKEIRTSIFGWKLLVTARSIPVDAVI